MENLARRWVFLAAGSAAALFALAACGDDPPAGVDGDLTGGWSTLPEVVGFVPEEGCHAQPYQQTAALVDYRPVECDQPHLTETVHVGTFSDEAADLDAPPPTDSDEQRQAYRECEQNAAEVLGDDFRAGRLWLGVSLPSDPGWEGGARWFRCDLVEVESVYGDPVERTGSLVGALGDESAEPELRLGCYRVAVDDSEVDEMAPVSCDEPHEAEYVGAWQAPDGPYPDPSDGDAEARVYEGCREQVAEYVDVPADGDLRFRTGTVADWMGEPDWQAGDRGFRCYLWLPDRELTESLAGAGEDGLPVQRE